MSLHADRVLKVVKCEQTSILETFMMLLVKECDDRYKGQFSFLLQVRYNMETIAIVVLVLFLIGGGGWGYSRWRG
jgi:hypothetical protein